VFSPITVAVFTENKKNVKYRSIPACSCIGADISCIFEENNNPMKRISRLLFSIFLILGATGASAQMKQPQADIRESTMKYKVLMDLISNAYVENIDAEKLTEEAIIAVLKELDPHSVYIPKKEVERTNEPLVGNFEGVGIQFQIYKDTILVISPVPGGPSDKLGIMAGDKIIKIDHKDAFGSKINNQYVLEHLRGAKGSIVYVDIYRKGRKELIPYTIVRDKIPLNSIDAAYMLTSDIGYIKLSRFAATSADEFIEAANTLKNKGMKNLVFDLRGNSGGYLNIAFDLADQFLPAGKLVVYTKGLRSPKQDFIATSSGTFESGKLVVLIDEGSASASEIVTGAVQDWDRGLIMGRRSFGKGLVQRPFMLPDSSMVRITTARYYTPSGRCIQKSYEDGKEDYEDEVFNRYKHGEMIHSDSIRFPDSLRYFTHNKRLVYGGGGIMPDYFIPLDTSAATKYYTDVLRKGLLNEYTIQYIEQNRKDLKKMYPDLESYKKGFTDTDKLLNDFVAFAATKEVPRNDADLSASGKQIKTVLKALIARNLFTQNAYFEVISEIDDDLSKAVDAIHNDAVFKKLTQTK
jgi:carboxyl-terminal processing protease